MLAGVILSQNWVASLYWTLNNHCIQWTVASFSAKKTTFNPVRPFFSILTINTHTQNQELIPNVSIENIPFEILGCLVIAVTHTRKNTIGSDNSGPVTKNLLPQYMLSICRRSLRVYLASFLGCCLQASKPHDKWQHERLSARQRS